MLRRETQVMHMLTAVITPPRENLTHVHHHVTLSGSVSSRQKPPIKSLHLGRNNPKEKEKGEDNVWNCEQSNGDTAFRTPRWDEIVNEPDQEVVEERRRPNWRFVGRDRCETSCGRKRRAEERSASRCRSELGYQRTLASNRCIEASTIASCHLAIPRPSIASKNRST